MVAGNTAATKAGRCLLERLQADRVLFERETSYIHYGGITKTRVIKKGCPQGSVLGPTLWNVCYNQVLTQEYPQGVKVIAFADDTAVLIEGDSMRELQESFKVVMVRIEQWASKVKLRFLVSPKRADNAEKVSDFKTLQPNHWLCGGA